MPAELLHHDRLRQLAELADKYPLSSITSAISGGRYSSSRWVKLFPGAGTKSKSKAYIYHVDGVAGGKGNSWTISLFYVFFCAGKDDWLTRFQLGHELAHIYLGHPFSTFGGNDTTEERQEADFVSAWWMRHRGPVRSKGRTGATGEEIAAAMKATGRSSKEIKTLLDNLAKKA